MSGADPYSKQVSLILRMKFATLREAAAGDCIAQVGSVAVYLEVHDTVAEAK